jgi:hypothetical protein
MGGFTHIYVAIDKFTKWIEVKPVTTTTAAKAVGVLLPHPPRDTPKVVSLSVGCHRDQELEGARNIKFRQVQAAESVIPYVLCGLYCLRW